MTATVLHLIPSTRATTGTVKTTLADVGTALGTGTVTVALRDNGKINATLVFIDGNRGVSGDVFNARNARNNAMYGVHTILGTVDLVLADDGTVSIADVDCMIDVDLDTKAALFTVDSTTTIVADASAAVEAAVVSVKRVKDGEIVAADVSLAEANEMIAKAKTGKKAALEIA